MASKLTSEARGRGMRAEVAPVRISEELALLRQRGGGARAAILCSLVNTCKAHQINPFTYLREVIDRVSTHPASRVEEITPRMTIGVTTRRYGD